MRIGRACWLCSLAVLVVVGWSTPASAAETGKACALLTPEEIEAATGLKISALNPGAAPGSVANPGTADLCSGATPAATILLRLAKRSGAAGREAKGIEAVKKMGAQVDVKNFGPITCSALVPPANLAAQVPFNTTCTVTKGEVVAGIEVTTRTRKDMVSIDKLRPLAEKMAQRF